MIDGATNQEASTIKAGTILRGVDVDENANDVYVVITDADQGHASMVATNNLTIKACWQSHRKIESN